VPEVLSSSDVKVDVHAASPPSVARPSSIGALLSAAPRLSM
jgi:hypothetical protein